MLKAKSGFILNAFATDEHDKLIKLAQDSRVDVPVRVPAYGVPINADSHLVDIVYTTKPAVLEGRAMKRTTVLAFESNIFNEGLIVETIKNKRAVLQFLVDNAKNRPNKARASRELERFNNEVRGLSANTILWLACVDKDGELYVSSSGVLADKDIQQEDVKFSDGSNVSAKLASRGDGLVTGAKLMLRHVTPLPATSVTEEDIKAAVSLTGCLLTIRGFHAAGRAADDVIAEWNMVAQPLLEYKKDISFSSWELPWAFTGFDGLGLSAADQARANMVAPYLTCSAELLASDATPGMVGTRLITLLARGEWSKANGVHTCRINSDRVTFEAKYSAMLDNALALDRAKLDQLGLRILQAAQTYGIAMGDGSLWATALWLEWLGVRGVLGGLAINASEG